MSMYDVGYRDGYNGWPCNPGPQHIFSDNEIRDYYEGYDVGSADATEDSWAEDQELKNPFDFA